jgi:hypothetical protein
MLRLEQLRAEMLERLERVDRHLAQQDQRLGRIEQRAGEIAERLETLQQDFLAQLDALARHASA